MLVIFQHPVWLMIVGLIHVLTVTSSQAGRDVIDGTEEFSFTLPPGRGPLFLSRFTPGLVFLTANALLGGMAIAVDLPQRLWSIIFSSGLTEPYPLVGEPLWYAMALLVPVAAHSLTFTIAALVGTRAGVNLSWMAGFAGVGAIVLAGNIAEKQLWHITHRTPNKPCAACGGRARTLRRIPGLSVQGGLRQQRRDGKQEQCEGPD